MLFTHAVAGAVIGLLVADWYTAGLLSLTVAGAFGGLVPDIDMVLEHRRSLHFPVAGTVVALAALVAGYWMGPVVQLFAVTLTGIAVHSTMDVLGGGKELRPWERTDPRASFNHVTGDWFMARRLVHDGSPGDLVLYLGLAGPLYSWGPTMLRPALVMMSVLAIGYAMMRRTFTQYIDPEYASISDVIKSAYRDGVGSVLR